MALVAHSVGNGPQRALPAPVERPSRGWPLLRVGQARRCRRAGTRRSGPPQPTRFRPGWLSPEDHGGSYAQVDFNFPEPIVETLMELLWRRFSDASMAFRGRPRRPYATRALGEPSRQVQNAPGRPLASPRRGDRALVEPLRNSVRRRHTASESLGNDSCLTTPCAPCGFLARRTVRCCHDTKDRRSAQPVQAISCEARCAWKRYSRVVRYDRGGH
jgi:hypothetical protein